ncbi:MAG: universal stress protein [Vicinamibacterales bacterium]
MSQPAADIRRILFPFDFSPQGLQAAPFVRSLAQRVGASVTVLSVVPLNVALMPVGMDDDVAVWTNTLRTRLDEAFAAEFEGVDVRRITDAGDPGERIVATAQTEGADLIMMPTHGLGLFRTMLVGSVASKVLHDATCPVWTAAHAEEQGVGGLPRTVVCAVDGRDESRRLLEWADRFTTRIGAALKVLHVVGPVTDWPSLEGERILQEQERQEAEAQVAAIEAAAGVEAPLLAAVGRIVTTVADYARSEHADLIIIGRGSLHEPLGWLRTHAFGIIQRSPCPVLSV